MFTIKKAACLSLILGVTGIVATTGSAHAATATTTNSARAHYELANALVKAGKEEQAIAEYKTAFRLSPDSQIGAFSLRALNAFGQLQPVAGAVGPESPKGKEIARLLQGRVGAVGPESPKTNEIARQALELKAQAKRQAADNIKTTNRGAQNQINNIEVEKTAAVNDVLANPSIQSTVVPVFNPFGFRRNRFGFGIVNSVDPVATQARIDQVKNIAELRKNQVKAQAADRNERLVEAQEERARLIDESADNLQTQTIGKGVQLDASQSNLFVRTYR